MNGSAGLHGYDVECIFHPSRDLLLVPRYKIYVKTWFFQYRRWHRPVRNRPTENPQIMNYWLVKLVYHNNRNHPAKYDGLGVHSHKVRFRLVNRVSLIFKTTSRDQIRGRLIFISLKIWISRGALNISSKSREIRGARFIFKVHTK